jgi:transcriptional regulator with XRE-family HTH domain
MEKELMSLVKSKARQMGITQGQVAKQLKVSLPTVKRWWAGKGVTLPVLNQLCPFLGLSLSELFQSLEQQGARSYTYTIEQEKMLVHNPQALALFDLIVSGKSLAYIKRKYPLKEHILTALLLKLDRAKLIEYGPEEKLKPVRTGEPQWIPGGPLSQKYRKTMIDSLLGGHQKNETTFFLHDYTPEDAALINSRMKELEKLMMVCNSRSISAPSSASYGVYMTFKKFEWDLRNLLSQG